MWDKRPDMIVRNPMPYNAEPPASVLADGEITAVDALYGRNHGPFPDISTAQWQLNVSGLVEHPLTLSYEQLTSEFTAHSVVATLACAGNRRAELLKVRPIPGKEPWAKGAISTAEWGGARPARPTCASQRTLRPPPLTPQRPAAPTARAARILRRAARVAAPQ
jgi:sulfite oxidase